MLLVAAMMVVAGALIVAWGLTTPLASDAALPHPKPTATAKVEDERPAATGAKDPAERLARLWAVCSRDLRPPLYDPPPVVTSQGPSTTQNARPAATLRVQLTGTAIDSMPGRSAAVLELSNGVSTICGEGQTIKDGGTPLKVIKVEPHRAVIEYGGNRHVLTRPRPAEE